MKTAVYPGSFDPMTNGHLDIVERMSKLYDKVIILVSVNSSKRPLFTHEERKAMIVEAVRPFDNVEVDSFSGLLVDYVKSKNAVIVKGLRALSDFEVEFQMALANRQLSSDVETLFLMTNMKYSHISSSLVKEINSYNGDISTMVPKNIEELLISRRKECEHGN